MNDGELIAAHGELVRDVQRYKRDHPWLPNMHEGKSAPARVPGWVLPRLERFAARLGYPVIYAGQLGDGELGTTEARFNPHEYEPVGITVQAGMSPASTARVLCHELAHAQYQNISMASPDNRMRLALARSLGRDIDGDLEEAVAETTAALVSRALRISDGDDFSHWYLATRTRYRPALLAQARADGIRRASRTLQAIA